MKLEGVSRIPRTNFIPHTGDKLSCIMRILRTVTHVIRGAKGTIWHPGQAGRTNRFAQTVMHPAQTMEKRKHIRQAGGRGQWQYW